jgi:putative transposase
MREELDALIGVGWGGSSPKRKGYRNGSYTRDLVTTTGQLDDLQVPRDREGQFHTQVFERYRRYEPQLAQGLTEMFAAGTSTHKVGMPPLCLDNTLHNLLQHGSQSTYTLRNEQMHS